MTISTGTAYYFYPFLEFGWPRLPHISGCQDKIVALYLAMRCYVTPAAIVAIPSSTVDCGLPEVCTKFQSLR